MWAHRFGHDEGRVVDRPYGPLAEGGLVGRWWGKRIVVCVLSTNVEERGREIAERHCERPVEPPKRGTKRIRNSWEAGTRGGIGLEHDERLVVRSGKLGRVDIVGDQVGGSVVL